MLSLSHAVLYSFIVFKYVILILPIKNIFKGELAYMLGDWGRSLTIYRDLESKGKILLGNREHYLQGFGWIKALFSRNQGSTDPPLVGGGGGGRGLASE